MNSARIPLETAAGSRAPLRRSILPRFSRTTAFRTPPRRRLACCVAGFCIIFFGAASARAADHQEKVGFNRSIRSILSHNCFKCHGFDEKERKSGLRLDRRDDAIRPARSGKPAIVPLHPEGSRLIERIFSGDETQVMPPPSSKKQLSQAEKELLLRWIREGAEYEEHWAFIPPRRPPLPEIRDAAWARNDLDRFILRRLEAEGLRPSPEADRARLIRRATFDLTGLPPTLAELDAFLADDGTDAYEKVVDRLLSSPHFGERMALDWLDVSRFADTNGYHIDNGRDMTRWREWVIDSFNDNKRFDRFTIEQLAGDLLPGSTLEQKVASGFNRNHMINFEGGAIPEEYHNAYIVDRVNTMSTVWLGLTLGCTQCHNHKFDPFTQKEYYQLYAFYHNVPENGLDGNRGNAAPFIPTPTADESRELARLDGEIRQAEAKLTAADPALDREQVQWEEKAGAGKEAEWEITNPEAMRSSGGAVLTRQEDGSILASGENPATEKYSLSLRPGRDVTALKLEALPHDSLPERGPGRSHNGNIVLTTVRAAIRAAGGAETPLRIKAASADFNQKDFSIALAIDDRPGSGWAILPETGKKHSAIFELGEKIRVPDGSVLELTLEFGSIFAQHQIGCFRVSATASGSPHPAHPETASIREILALEPGKRNAKQQDELRRYYRGRFTDGGKETAALLDRLKKSRADAERRARTTMVMSEMEKPRDTFILMRGQYDKKGELVRPGVPAALSPLPEGAPANRLGLARWLVSPEQPLTARVIVNRYWQMFFGAGIVKTADDFGTQGEFPTHPELLDWLASEFLAGGWNVKALVRSIVTSAAYRQTAAVTPHLLEADPENRLLARGARFRLQAEFIRDQALAVSGLLDPRIGGHSVSPYQPTGLWEELMSREDGANWSAQSYTQSHGPDLYRRTLYTFWKRTCPPPTLATFDAPDRETCTVRRSRTNTPLQALILMNDPTYVEASRKLAERLLLEGGGSTSGRLALAFRLALSRKPSAEELSILENILEAQLAAYRKDPAAASRLQEIGEAPRQTKLDAAELSAWTIVASVILNLDETVTKG